MLFYFPLELLEERYTRQMYNTCITSLSRAGASFKSMLGEALSDETQGHQFLDPISRANFSLSQVGRWLLQAYYTNPKEIMNGDKVFAADLWHPGLEAVKYFAELEGVDIDVYAINYAGPFSPHDLTTLKFGNWGKYQEVTWMLMCKKVFFGSQWHIDTVLEGIDDLCGADAVEEIQPKCVATGLVWDDAWVKEASQRDFRRSPIVLWPHRMAPSRNVQEFYALVDYLAPRYPHVRWVISSSRPTSPTDVQNAHVEFMRVSKEDYYALMRDARLVLSTGLQETFGYTIHEATALDTPILCPDRSSYDETVLSGDNLYDPENFGDMVEKTVAAIERELPVATLKKRGYFNAMMKEMDIC